MILVKKNSFGKGIYNSFQENHNVGDRIYLEHILFDMGKSTLSSKIETRIRQNCNATTKKQQLTI